MATLAASPHVPVARSLARAGRPRRSSSPTCRSSTRTITSGTARAARYLLEELLADTGTGHNIRATVFVECRVDVSRATGPEELRPVGETEFVNGVAAHERQRHLRPDARLRRHRRPCRPDAGRRGRAGAGGPSRAPAAAASAASATSTALATPSRDGAQQPASTPPPGLLLQPRLPRRLRAARRARPLLRGLALPPAARRGDRPCPRRSRRPRSCSTTAAARSASGPMPGRRDEVFASWRAACAELAACPNVVVKLGGLAHALSAASTSMQRRSRPPREQLAEAWRPYDRDLHRGLRRRALHVREQLPGRQGHRALRRCSGTPSSASRRAPRRPRRRRCSAARRRGSTASSTCRTASRRTCRPDRRSKHPEDTSYAPSTYPPCCRLRRDRRVAGGTGPAKAQAWPDRPLRLIVPYPPGGAVDLAGRLIAEALRDRLGQPVIVETFRARAATSASPPRRRPRPLSVTMRPLSSRKLSSRSSLRSRPDPRELAGVNSRP